MICAVRDLCALCLKNSDFTLRHGPKVGGSNPLAPTNYTHYTIRFELKRLPKWLARIIYVLWLPWVFIHVWYCARIRGMDETQLREKFSV